MQIKSFEDRQFGRRRSLIHAIVVNKRGGRTMCLVRNISPGGALLEVEDQGLLSQQLTLIIDADAFEADCDVRHRTEHAIGVYFTAVRIGRNGRDTRFEGPQLQASMQPILISDIGRR